jgi:hypothetical protein
LTFKTPEHADQFFLEMESLSRQLAAILGPRSDAQEAVNMLDDEKARGNDVVIIFTENRWIVGPRPSWDRLKSP